MYFVTKSGTVYTVDTTRRTINNGKGKEFKYESCEPIIVGQNARFYLTGGATLVTTHVVRAHA